MRMHGRPFNVIPVFFIFIISLRTPSSEITCQNSNELCHVFGGKSDLKRYILKLGYSPLKSRANNRRFWVGLRRHRDWRTSSLCNFRFVHREGASNHTWLRNSERRFVTFDLPYKHFYLLTMSS